MKPMVKRPANTVTVVATALFFPDNGAFQSTYNSTTHNCRPSEIVNIDANGNRVVYRVTYPPLMGVVRRMFFSLHHAPSLSFK